MQTQTCMEIHSRVKYVGNYTSHECDIEVSNVTSEDSGLWTCNVQSYVIGAHATRTSLDLDLVVKSPTTTAGKFVLNKLNCYYSIH